MDCLILLSKFPTTITVLLFVGHFQSVLGLVNPRTKYRLEITNKEENRKVLSTNKEGGAANYCCSKFVSVYEPASVMCFLSPTLHSSHSIRRSLY
jgi:hypothetical protein